MPATEGDHSALLNFLAEKKLNHLPNARQNIQDPVYLEMVSETLAALRATPEEGQRPLLDAVRISLETGEPFFTFNSTNIADFFRDLALLSVKSEDQPS